MPHPTYKPFPPLPKPLDPTLKPPNPPFKTPHQTLKLYHEKLTISLLTSKPHPSPLEPTPPQKQLFPYIHLFFLHKITLFRILLMKGNPFTKTTPKTNSPPNQTPNTMTQQKNTPTKPSYSPPKPFTSSHKPQPIPSKIPPHPQRKRPARCLPSSGGGGVGKVLHAPRNTFNPLKNPPLIPPSKTATPSPSSPQT